MHELFYMVDFTINFTLSLGLTSVLQFLKSRPGGRSYRKRRYELLDYTHIKPIKKCKSNIRSHYKIERVAYYHPFYVNQSIKDD